MIQILDLLQVHVCNKHQEKSLDSFDKDNSLGSWQRHLSGKNLPITWQIPEEPRPYIHTAHVQEANHRSVSSAIEPPSVMHRNHSMDKVILQVCSNLPPESMVPLLSTHDRSGAQFSKMVDSPSEHPKEPHHTSSQSGKTEDSSVTWVITELPSVLLPSFLPSSTSFFFFFRTGARLTMLTLLQHS